MQLAPLSDQPDPYHFAGNRKSFKGAELVKALRAQQLLLSYKKVGSTFDRIMESLYDAMYKPRTQMGPQILEDLIHKMVQFNFNPPKRGQLGSRYII